MTKGFEPAHLIGAKALLNNRVPIGGYLQLIWQFVALAGRFGPGGFQFLAGFDHGQPLSVMLRLTLFDPFPVVFINRNSLRWHDAPAEHGPHKTLYNRWKRWNDKGIFARIMAGLAAMIRAKKRLS